MRIEKWALRTWMLPPVAFMVAATSTPLLAAPAPGSSFVQHNLVSDIPGLALYTHPSLGNPWGVWFRRRVRSGSATTPMDWRPSITPSASKLGLLSSTPEPGTPTLVGIGFASLICYGLRRGKRRA